MGIILIDVISSVKNKLLRVRRQTSGLIQKIHPNQKFGSCLNLFVSLIYYIQFVQNLVNNIFSGSFSGVKSMTYSKEPIKHTL